MTLVPKFATKRSLVSLAVLNLSMFPKTPKNLDPCHSVRSNPPEGMIYENISIWYYMTMLPFSALFTSHVINHFAPKTLEVFPILLGLLRPMASPDPFPKELRLMAWHSRARRIRRRASAPWMMAVSMELVWAVVRDRNSEELWISSFVSFLLWRPGDF